MTGKKTQEEVAAKPANLPVAEEPKRKRVSVTSIDEAEVCATVYIPDLLSETAGEGARVGAVERLRGIAPRDSVEAMLAVQMIATHNAVMECSLRSSISPPELSLRYMNEATKSQGLFLRQMEALDKHRGKGQQKVVVEHVHVEAGGQAVVGQVHTGGRALQGPSASGAKPAAAIAPPSRPALPMHLEAGADTVALQTGARASKAPTLEVMPTAPIPSPPDPALRKQPENGAVAAVRPAHIDKPAAPSAPQSRPTLGVASEPSAEPVAASAPAGARPSREEPALTTPAAVAPASPTRPGSSSDAGRQPAASPAHPGARPSPVDARPAATPASPTRPRLSSRRVKFDDSVKAA